MQHLNFFRNLDAVVRELHARGHEVVLLHGTQMDDEKTRAKVAKKRETMVFIGRGIEVAQSDIPNVSVGYRPEPPEERQLWLRRGRGVINRALYFRRGHPSPDRVTKGLDKELPAKVRARLDNPLVRIVLGNTMTLRVWRWIERASRPSPVVRDLLEGIGPDVILVSPTVWPKRPVEADYIRAARSLRIPTIGYLNSWDNLTSKGAVHVLPDVFMVWNEALADEAVEIHDIPRKIIRITGAAHLDRFFEMEPTRALAEVRSQMGCDPETPYVVYLCSSRTLIANEVHVATAIADALAERFPDGPATLLVRPHPTNPPPWDGFDHPGIVVYPKHGDQADDPGSWQEYYNQLSGALCVFGLNTTAFLEAVVAQRPCLTIVADEFFHAQGKTGHFRHLLAADFLEVSSDAEEVAGRIARILEGADEKAAGRRYFTEWFLRPCGVEEPATRTVADMVERMVASATPALRRAPEAIAAPDRARATEEHR